MYRKTYIEINLDNISNNVKQTLNNYNNYDYYIGVVKGNAYGHGSYIVNELIEAGINYLAVSSLDEALDIRKENKFIPILCLEPISLEYIDKCILNNITLTIHDYNYFKNLISLNLTDKIRFHLKINSGMNRLGLDDKNQVKEIVNYMNESENLVLEGIFTHFGTPGISDKVWDNQLAKFKEITSLIDLDKIKIVHLGKSMTLINHPKISFANGIRLGIIMYGFDQTPRFQKGIMGTLRKIKADMRIEKQQISKTTTNLPIILKEAYSLHSEIIQIRDIKKGDYVGYGTDYQALSDEKIAVVAIGYADGYSRKNHGGIVYINNKKYNIIGDICMGMIMVRVDNTININDDVELIGNNLTVKRASKQMKTTVYEAMCMFDKKLPKLYTKNGKLVKIVE